MGRLLFERKRQMGSYVTSFPDARGKWQVSSAGGMQPRWRRDGRELFYLAPDGKLMALPTGINFDPALLSLCSNRTHANWWLHPASPMTLLKRRPALSSNTQLKNPDAQPMPSFWIGTQRLTNKTALKIPALGLAVALSDNSDASEVAVRFSSKCIPGRSTDGRTFYRVTGG